MPTEHKNGVDRPGRVDGPGPVAVVTGGSGGIGLSVCERFVAAGYRTVSLSRRRPPAVEGLGHIKVDLAERAAVESVAGELVAFVGEAARVVLVHNAADLADDSAFTVDRDRLVSQLHISLVSAFELNRVLKPTMRSGSSIVYVGSTLSESATAGCASYTAIKHAVIGMMRATCQDAFDAGIHTAAVCPGFTMTEMLSGRLEASGTDPSALLGLQARVAEPGDIAEVITSVAENPVYNGGVIHASFGQKST